MQIHSVGIDLGKTTFHLVALGAAGKVLVKKKFTQRQLLAYTANMQTSLIGLEACSGAHFLGRALRKQGHDAAKPQHGDHPTWSLPPNASNAETDIVSRKNVLA
jgi:hypothetical protein